MPDTRQHTQIILILCRNRKLLILHQETSVHLPDKRDALQCFTKTHIIPVKKHTKVSVKEDSYVSSGVLLQETRHKL